MLNQNTRPEHSRNTALDQHLSDGSILECLLQNFPGIDRQGDGVMDFRYCFFILTLVFLCAHSFADPEEERRRTVKAIHDADKSEFLKAGYKWMAPLFRKTNTEDGAVVESRLPIPGLVARVPITTSEDGTRAVEEGSEFINGYVEK